MTSTKKMSKGAALAAEMEEVLSISTAFHAALLALKGRVCPPVVAKTLDFSTPVPTPAPTTAPGAPKKAPKSTKRLLEETAAAAAPAAPKKVRRVALVSVPGKPRAQTGSGSEASLPAAGPDASAAEPAVEASGQWVGVDTPSGSSA